MNFTYNFFFIYVLIIFFMGLFSFFLSKKNYFFMIISIEIMLISINLNFAAASIYLDDIFGVYYIIFILALSGSEISLGLAIFILLYRKAGISSIYTLQNIKG